MKDNTNFCTTTNYGPRRAERPKKDGPAVISNVGYPDLTAPGEWHPLMVEIDGERELLGGVARSTVKDHVVLSFHDDAGTNPCTQTRLRVFRVPEADLAQWMSHWLRAVGMTRQATELASGRVEEMILLREIPADPAPDWLSPWFDVRDLYEKSGADLSPPKHL